MARRRPGAVVALLLLLVAACSGGAHPAASSSNARPGSSTAAGGSTPPAGERQANSAPAASAPAASVPAAASARGSAPSSTSGTATSSGSPSPQASPSEIPLHASLAKACVVPGSAQTLTVHARPGMSVIFDTLYPDQKDGQAYGGIDAHGRTDTSGAYVSTWTVSAAAPIGQAKVNAAAITDDGTATAHQILPFTIALHCP